MISEVATRTGHVKLNAYNMNETGVTASPQIVQEPPRQLTVLATEPQSKDFGHETFLQETKKVECSPPRVSLPSHYSVPEAPNPAYEEASGNTKGL